MKSDYDRVVRQRTTLLRSIAGARGATARAGAESTLAVWDDQLVTHGAALLFGRLSLLNEIDGLVATAYEQVAPGKSASIAYLPRSFADLGNIQRFLVTAMSWRNCSARRSRFGDLRSSLEV